MTGMIHDIEFDETRLRDAAGDGHTTATDLADWLVRVLGLPFRRAHHVTGTLVGLADDKACILADLTLAEMQKIEPGITEDVFSVLGVDQSVASRTSHGGTAPDNVRAAAADARRRFL
jgi:argininosuccinate lyase